MNLTGNKIMKNPMILKNKAVIFLSSMAKYDCYDTVPFDPGMKARVVDIQKHPIHSVNYIVTLDFTEFEDENSELASRSWSGPEGHCTLYWRETEFYPESKRSRLTFFNDHPPFKIMKNV
jgi:hypothetical protein